jgi:N-acetylmuramoyl-L-alanine amidase
MVKALGTVNKGVKTEDFYLLRSITTSSIHIEVAYLTNPEEETKLLDEKYIESIAASIAKGIIEYYS